MLQLNRESLKNKAEWERAGIATYAFDDEKMRARTERRPEWVHFGPGNIFRAFVAAAQQTLLDAGAAETGIIAVAPYDAEVVDKLYRPHDSLSLLVTMHADGRLEKRVIGSIAEALVCNTNRPRDWQRLREIFANPSLKIASFTITEKGYKMVNSAGEYTKEAAADLERGPKAPQSFMGRIAALAYQRYLAGGLPIALLSLDNCARNGEKLKAPLVDLARAWASAGLAESAFVDYIRDERRVAFPCSMIDKITPRPSERVQAQLKECGITGAEFIRTARNSYYAPFVNAERAQYLVIEDKFPNGRMPLEKAGVIFADRDTVDKVERMKVCTCLNPLHTALAVFGCLLGYTLIADEMKHPLLRGLAEKIGRVEGLPVVKDPGVLNPEAFIKEVFDVRLPNPHIPDTPQRIASDTSQKVGIRFGETIKAYRMDARLKAADLTYIPLAIAGWCRYLLGVDDRGKAFDVSPDPLLEELQNHLRDVVFGKPDSLGDALRPILSNVEIFGSDLYEVGLGEKIEGYVRAMLSGAGAVEKTLARCLK